MKKELNLKNVRIYSKTKDNIRDAIDLVGQKVYMSDDADFHEYSERELVGVTYTENGRMFSVEYPFAGKDSRAGTCEYRYFVLCKDVKFKGEKKLRPFASIQEFTDVTGCKIGDKITITCVNLGYEDFCVFNGVRRNLDTHTTSVMLGSSIYSFDKLKDYYLFYKNGKWCPFGIEE